MVKEQEGNTSTTQSALCLMYSVFLFPSGDLVCLQCVTPHHEPRWGNVWNGDGEEGF
jgi:hypothetical protein